MRSVETCMWLVNVAAQYGRSERLQFVMSAVSMDANNLMRPMMTPLDHWRTCITHSSMSAFGVKHTSWICRNIR